MGREAFLKNPFLYKRLRSSTDSNDPLEGVHQVKSLSHGSTGLVVEEELIAFIYDQKSFTWVYKRFLGPHYSFKIVFIQVEN